MYTSLSTRRCGIRRKAVDRIDQFKGEFKFLSNFWSSAVRLDSDEFPDTYPTVEHAFQAAKTLSRRERREVREAATPELAKLLGRQVTLRPAWDMIKLNVMRDLIWQKFTIDTDLRARLLATEDAELVEGNTWGDRYWGVDLETGAGENMLGKVLMAVREKIRKQQHAVLFAKRVAPELGLFEDMLKRAKIQFTKDERNGKVAFTINNEDGNGTVDAEFDVDGRLVAVAGYGY